MRYIENKYGCFILIFYCIPLIVIIPIGQHLIGWTDEYDWYWEILIERQTWFTILWVLGYQYLYLPIDLILSFNRAFKGKMSDIKWVITKHGEILFGGGICYYLLTLIVDVSNAPVIQVPIGYQILLGFIILIIDLYTTPDSKLYKEEEKE